MRNALGVVLRKDMSLNRRLYSWILGSNLSYLTPICLLLFQYYRCFLAVRKKFIFDSLSDENHQIFIKKFTRYLVY
jgi:hypothetical protein